MSCIFVEGSHKWTFEDTFIHCLLFFLGGYTATSSVLSFALYELAKSPSIQEKLRDEVRKTLKETDGQLCYDKIRQMRFLGNVVSGKNKFSSSFNCFILKISTKNTIIIRKEMTH